MPRMYYTYLELLFSLNEGVHLMSSCQHLIRTAKATY